jgi:hypothetical protein
MVEFIMTVDRCEHADMALIENEGQVTDEENDLQLQVTKSSRRCMSAELDGSEWAMEPQLGVTAVGPSRVEEEEEEEGDQYMEPGVDHEGDDPVGVDEEWRYVRKVPEAGSNEKVQQEKKKTESSKNVTLLLCRKRKEKPSTSNSKPKLLRNLRRHLQQPLLP